MSDLISESAPLGFPWVTTDPFLFCVHHLDHYPAGNHRLGPKVSLAGRNLGQDFELRDGFRMYHGEVVPGFPQHPHRGFETVTVVRRGYVDHSDSLGATARYGMGDVQWMTAGSGIVHAEMFPLLDEEGPNTLELFQLWLNLPAADKLTEPHIGMLWSEEIPRHEIADDAGRRAVITVVAGRLDGARAPAPPPRSWAARPESDVAIWCVDLDPGARVTLPPATHPDSVRTVYFYRGDSVVVGSEERREHRALAVRADRPLPLEAGPDGAQLLLLQGRPIGEPVAHHGPFVMNTRQELQRAFADYQKTRFGGWPWPSDDHTHPRDAGRFARYADGREERPPATPDASAAQ